MPPNSDDRCTVELEIISALIDNPNVLSTFCEQTDLIKVAVKYKESSGENVNEFVSQYAKIKFDKAAINIKVKHTFLLEASEAR